MYEKLLRVLRAPAEEGGGAGVDNGADGASEEETEKTTFTKDELDEAIKKAEEAAAAAAAKKHEKELAKAKAEAERLAKMTESERVTAELEEARKEIAKQRQELEDEKKSIKIKSELAKKKLPASLLKSLMLMDADEAIAEIAALEKEYQKSVEAAVTEKFAKKPPGAAGTKPDENKSSVYAQRANARRKEKENAFDPWSRK